MTREQLAAMKLLITGASGFIGSALIRQLVDEQHQIIGLSRKPARLQNKFTKLVAELAVKKGDGASDAGSLRAIGRLDEIEDNEAIDVIVNLAGEPILDRRWSQARKQKLYNSRLDTTAAVIDLIARLEHKPSVLVSGSAVGFYGSYPGNRVLNEQSEGRAGFTHKLCADWENRALGAELSGVRVCLLRTGVVLGPGGALKRMLPPFKLGLGGRIGTGKQWFSWIHLNDMVAVILFLIEHQVLSGVFNATAPEPVTNAVFSKALGEVLDRPVFLPMPAVVMQLLLGEGAELLCEGQRVVPFRLQEAGFEFSQPALESALRASI